MPRTVIVGGGVAGLTAAYYLQEARHPFVLLEASDRLGGRMRTDVVDGYHLDRGFQVFLTAYPEAQRILDYKALQLATFKPGAVILLPDGKTSRIGDPLRDLSSLIPTLMSSIASIGDKWAMLRLKSSLKATSIETIFGREEQTTLSALREDYGFSDGIIRDFFMPFYRGIFLEEDLSTSRRMFDFVFKMFSEGDAAMPAGGIEQIPQQIASHLSLPDIKLDTAVSSISQDHVTTIDGQEISYDRLILAVDGRTACQLLGRTVPTVYRSTTTMYFGAESSGLAPRLIHLLPDGIVNNVCDLSSVDDQLVPTGKRLISVTLRGGAADATPEMVASELARWLPEASQWLPIKTYKIDYALPDQTSVRSDIIEVVGRQIICGDHLQYGSVNAAMQSGRLAAEEVINR